MNKARHCSYTFSPPGWSAFVNGGEAKVMEMVEMVNGDDIVKAVKRLCLSYKRPVSIVEVAAELGVTVEEIEGEVLLLLKMGILEGSLAELQPGPTNGLY